MSEKYILDGRTPIRVDDLMAWARWFEGADRRVAVTEQGDVRVSTVFLGLDHGYRGRPLLFETMVFGGPSDMQEQVRYSTWDEAEAGHAAMVRKVISKAYAR